MGQVSSSLRRHGRHLEIVYIYCTQNEKIVHAKFKNIFVPLLWRTSRNDRGFIRSATRIHRRLLFAATRLRVAKTFWEIICLL